jgi:hypothetical protein
VECTCIFKGTYLQIVALRDTEESGLETADKSSQNGIAPLSLFLGRKKKKKRKCYFTV